MVHTGLLGERYELRDILGFGGMAEVHDGWDTRLGRAVAIKLLYPGLSSQADVRARFRIEARAAAALNHPNIVGVYDFGDQGGTPFIVMERLPGDTLGDQIARGPLPQDRVFSALRSVLAALAAAHDAGMLHRDIKPGNILLAPPGDVKVADFGIVKAPGSVHTTSGQIVGTLAYLSPDRITGNPASVADDLYAAGVVGYEALTGCRPFTQEDIVPLAHAIIEAVPTPVTRLRPDVDPHLVEVIERAMSRDPRSRFSSAEAMRTALNGETPWRARPVPVTAQQRPPTRVLNTRRPPTASPVKAPMRARGAAGAAALLAAMALAAVAFALDPTSTPRPTESRPAGISTSVSTPESSPVSVAAVPQPAVQPRPAPSSPVVEQAIQQEAGGKSNGNGRGNGNGNGGNGNGNGKPK